MRNLTGNVLHAQRDAHAASHCIWPLSGRHHELLSWCGQEPLHHVNHTSGTALHLLSF
jgi:hypothetical protein